MKVQNSGLRVQDLKVRNSGFRVQALGFQVRGLLSPTGIGYLQVISLWLKHTCMALGSLVYRGGRGSTEFLKLRV